MGNKGLKVFVPQAFSPRVVAMKSAAYTVTYSDDLINLTGAAPLTLPALSDMASSKLGSKTFKVYNGHTAAVAITPATGDTINGGAASYSVPAGGTVIFGANQGDGDWTITNPTQEVEDSGIKDATITGAKALMKKWYPTVVDVTSGTTAQNVFGAAGAPCAMTLTSVVVIGKDTNAANILVIIGTTTAASVAKGTSVGLVTGEDTLATAAVAAGDVVTVESSATNGNALVLMTFEVA